MSSTSAPDVDLKARGISWHFYVGAVGIALGAYYIYGGDASAEDVEAPADGPASIMSILGLVVLRIVQVFLVLAILLVGLLVARQRSILYVPSMQGTSRSPSGNPDPCKSPTNWGLPYSDVWITTEDNVRLHGWLIYQPLESCKDVVPYTFAFFHGNAGNIGHRLENLRDMRLNLKINILIIDYRGYGDSDDGSGPSEDGFLKDALATYRWLAERCEDGPVEETRTRMASDRLCLFGRSIGGAVCLKLAEALLRKRLRGDSDAMPMPTAIVLENTFTSIAAMALQIFPFLVALSPLLRRPLVLDEWRSADRVRFLAEHYKNWSCCLLGGARDELVPPAQMKALHDLLKLHRPKVLKYFVFKNGGHNDTPQKGGKAYWDSFRTFLELVQDAANGMDVS